MKYTLSTVFLCLALMLQGQITFQEVTPPDDFSLSVIRKSPAGEYFTQAINDRSRIYTSLDGVNWSEESLPQDRTLDDIQFYTDGTPVMKFDYNDNLVRRDGAWSILNLFVSGSGGVSASFIKGDTLFAYENDSFAYSLDKGATFVPLFTYGETIFDHNTHLWVFDHLLVLHHTAGASDYLSAFTREGTRVLHEEMNISGSPEYTFNTCGQVMLYDNSNFFRFSAQGVTLNSGSLSVIAPGYTSSDEIFSANGNWYHRSGASLNKTTGCNFDWVEVLHDSLLLMHYDRWLSEDGDLLITNQRSDTFFEFQSESSDGVEWLIPVNYSNLREVDESYLGAQVSTTPNEVFLKDVVDGGWAEIMPADDLLLGAKFSPNGDLYLNRGDAILYSQDNGQSFTTIEVPEGDFPLSVGTMTVLDDGILFIEGGLLGGSFYTLNNGQDWMPASINLSIDPVYVGMAGINIIVADLGFQHEITQINTLTNETITENLGNFYGLNPNQYTIRSDGSIFFYYEDSFTGQEPGLYHFKFGEQLSYLGVFPEIASCRLLRTSGMELFAFNQGEYYAFDGEGFVEYGYTGIPTDDWGNFFLATNQHLYLLIDGHHIFRSTTPLSSPQSLTGTLFYDENQDCLSDQAENTLAYWRVKVEGDDFMRIKSTDSNGDFAFSVPPGDYTVSTQLAGPSWELCESSAPVVVHQDDVEVTQDFQAKALAECAGLELDFSTPLLRRCFDNYYTVRVRNTGPLASGGTSLVLQLDPYFDFLSATIPYTQLSDTEYQFDLGVLEVNDEVVFRIEFNLSCEAELGQQHCLSGILTDMYNCPSLAPGYIECQENIGSFDPNDKRIFNEDGLETTTVDTSEYIYYHIRFQNTGTDTAFTVRIVDPLSPILDLNTLVMLSASHSYEYLIDDGANLTVTFDNILLPDSTTNEPASRGYFKFKVKPLSEYGYGTSISNLAGIYFDFNEPVITNEAVLTIENPVGTREPLSLIDFQLYPNPTRNVLSLSPVDYVPKGFETVEVVNSFGQLMLKKTWIEGQKVDVSFLPAGIYQLVLKASGQPIGMASFVKI